MKIMDVEGDNAHVPADLLLDRNTLLPTLALRFCRVLLVQCWAPACPQLKARTGCLLLATTAWSLALSLAFTRCSDLIDDASALYLLYLWSSLLVNCSKLDWSSGSSSCMTELLASNFNLLSLWSSSWGL